MSVDETVDESVSEDTETQDEQKSEVDGSEETQQEASDDTDGTSKEEEWVVPGKYKTVEDLKNAQRYFESENSRRANELHRLKTQQSSRAVDPKEEVDRFAEAVKRNPVDAVRDIVRGEVQDTRMEVRQARFESEYKHCMQNKEFAELEPEMVAIAQQYDGFLDENAKSDPKLLHILFYAAKGLKADEKARKAAISGKVQGERTALKKAKAQVEGASGSKGNTKRKFEELSLADMRKELAKGNV